MAQTLAKIACALVLFAGLSGSAQSPMPSSNLTPSWSSRVAALQFGLANGLRKPAGEIVVAEDAYFGAVDGHPAALSAEDTAREAREMAALIGPDVRVVRAIDYLVCQSRTNNGCWTSRNVSVIVVGGLYQGNTPGSHVQFYMPGLPDNPSSQASLTHAVIDLERRGDAWIGTAVRLGPSTLTRGR